MKNLRFLAFILICSVFSAAQAAAPAPNKKPADSTAKKPAVWQHVPGTDPGDEPIITLKSQCPKPKPGAPKSICRDTVTRKDFEEMVKAAGPSMTPPMERSFASNLSRMIAYGNEASRMGLQNTPEGKQLMEFARMQAMAQMLGRKLRSDAEKVSPGEMQTYYSENKSKYENASLERIVIPTKAAETDKKVAQDYADKIRARWVAGEDPEKLQKEAFEWAGSTGPQPPVKLGERKLTTVPPAQASITQLKAGEISSPFADPAGTSIYKMVSKSEIPFDQAKEEISKTLSQKHLEDMVKALDNRTPATLNDAYFASLAGAQPTPAATKAPAPTAPAVAPTPAQPPSAPAPTAAPAPKTEEHPK